MRSFGVVAGLTSGMGSDSMTRSLAASYDSREQLLTRGRIPCIGGGEEPDSTKEVG